MLLDPRMSEAMRLTRSGGLREATDLIQSMLAGNAAPAQGGHDGLVIDLTPTRVTVDAKPVTGMVARSGGAIDYLLYVPADAKPGLPLVVMLHGCTQTPEDFARGTGMNALADQLGFIVAYPRQTQRRNAQKCWNWFAPGDQQRDRGEPALIAGIVRDVIRDERADPARVYVAGLSAGGAAAAIMAQAYPDIFAAVGVHSGLACGSARDLPSALSAMKTGAPGTPAAAFVPAIVFHGDRDSTVHEANGNQIITAAATAFGSKVQTRTDKGDSPGGRHYTRVSSLDPAGRVLIEHWTIHGAGHAWSGGKPGGSYTDPKGPDASREMLRFFLTHRKG